MVTDKEIHFARTCMEKALSMGASQVRVQICKSVSDEISLVNGEIDKVMHQADRSLTLNLFADGRYGVFNTNRFDDKGQDAFVKNAVQTVLLLSPDKCRRLPEIELTSCLEALGGKELEMYDDRYEELEASGRISLALGESLYAREGFDMTGIISEELGYSDMVEDNYMLDSNGFEGRQIETSYYLSCEVTVEDEEGRKYSGDWWDRSSFLDTLPRRSVAVEACRRARAQRHPQGGKKGKMNLVVEAKVASRLMTPVLNALQAGSIQQCNSFLMDSRGRKMFPEFITLWDRPRVKGQYGSRLFDSEGIATKDRKIIDRGIVTDYFVSTYMSLKMGIPVTVDGISHTELLPYLEDSDKKDISLQRILEKCGSGILVTGFNGGNCNSATGNYSFGIEGFAFKDGKVQHPVTGMLITGNMMELWNSVIAIGNDARPNVRYSIPTLAFRNVDFSA